MRHVALHVSEGISLDVERLDGELVSRRRGLGPLFDDPSSYTLRIKTAQLSVDENSLTALVSRIFSGSSSVSDLQLSIADDHIVQTGKLHKGITVPFSMSTSVSVTPDGRLRLHATSVKAVGIPVKGLLDVFGVDLASLIRVPGGRGIQVDGSDILLAPAAALPPPETEGKVTAARIDGRRLTLEMSGPAQPPPRPDSLPDPSAKNYVYFHGGSIVFGKLTMADADLQLVDPDPADPFDFFPEHYSEQLVAGYSQNTERKGLKVMMPDYADVREGRGRPKPPALPPSSSGHGRTASAASDTPSSGH